MLRLLAPAAVLTGVLATAASAGDLPRQHDLTARSHARVVQASLGSHCTPTSGGMLCADYAYPLETEGRLPVHGSGRIWLEFRAEPEEIHPELRDHRSRRIYELTARGSGLERTIRLPRELPRGMDRLGVFVSYKRGSADFEVDLRRHRH